MDGSAQDGEAVGEPALIDGPASFFPRGETVWVLPPAGFSRLGTSAGRPSERYADGSLFPASRPSAKVRREVYRLLLAVGAARKVEGNADSEVEGVLERIATLTGRYSRLVVTIGTPGPGSKATLVLQGRDERTVAYAKVAWTDSARRLVRNEAAVLPLVCEDVAPLLLGVVETELLSCVLVSPLEGSGMPFRADVPDVLVARAADGGPKVPLASHPAVAAMREVDAETTERAVACLPGRDYAVLPTHGDAAPWNAIRCRDGAVRLFDWEYGCREGLPLMDVAHWSLQTGYLVRRMNPQDAVRSSIDVMARRVGCGAVEAAALCALTASDVTARLAAEGQTAHAAWWLECRKHAIVRAEGGAL